MFVVGNNNSFVIVRREGNFIHLFGINLMTMTSYDIHFSMLLLPAKQAHPSESYFIFQGRLTKADGTASANADEVALTNNAIMHLFSRIEYHL